MKKTEKRLSHIFSVFEKNYKEIPLEVFGKHPYKTLVSTLLSSRTKDEVTLKAAKRLFAKAPNFKRLASLDSQTISSLIFPVGFYKTKAKFLKKLAKIVLQKYKGRVPENFRDLVALPGVGRKTANLVINRAFGKPAIAVDVHVHRISNLLGIVKTKRPEDTESMLKKIVVRKYWHKVNRLFVSIGRQFRSKKALTEFLHSL